MVKEMPVTVKRAIELMGLFVLGTIIVAGNTIIMPLLMAFFFSLMLLPVFRFFRKIKVPEVIAVFLPILLFTIIVALLIWLFSSQVSALLDDFPKIQHTVAKHLDDLSIRISRSFGYSPAEQVKFINTQSKKLFSSLGGVLSGAAGSLSGIIIFLGLLPIYIYFIMLYRNLFVRFTLMWFPKDQHLQVDDIIRQTEVMVKSYQIGLLIQITYIIILKSDSQWLFDIQNALLIGIIFALLNLIPY